MMRKIEKNRVVCVIIIDFTIPPFRRITVRIGSKARWLARIYFA